MKISRVSGGKCGMRLVLAVMPMLLASAAVSASESGHREHGAHEHGHGTLDVVAEGEELLIELRVPAVNVVGFEHAPGTDAEREAVRQALVRFRDPAAVLMPSPDAECEPERVDVDLLSMGRGEHHEHDGHHEDHGQDQGKDEPGHGEHGHAHEKNEHEHEEHGHDERHEGGHEEHAADSGTETHSELSATYRFHCHTPERLDWIQVRAFALLHDVEEIEARVVTPAVQRALDLRPGDAVVELSR